MDYDVTVYRGLDGLPDDVRALLADDRPTSYYDTLSWYRNLAGTALDPGQNVRVYAARPRSAGAVASVALPMVTLADGHSPALQSLSNFYTTFYSPSIAEGLTDATDALAAIARTVRADAARWPTVDLRPLLQDSPRYVQVRNAFARAGFWTGEYYCFGNWILDVKGQSFDAYFAERPSRLRNTVKRSQKKFDADPEARIEIITDGPGLEAAIEAYGRVYAASWKQPEPYPEFTPGLIRTCASNGWLRLGVAWVGAEPAAAQIWIVKGDTASIFKLAYDERFIKRSIGSLLTVALMRHAMDIDKVHVVDYLTGDDAYKQEWMSHRRECWGIRAFNPRSLRGTIQAARHGLGVLMRSIRRKPAAEGRTPAPATSGGAAD